MKQRFWIGVVSEEHVKIGEKDGFAQLCHGKYAPLKRMNARRLVNILFAKNQISRREPSSSLYGYWNG